MTPKEIERVAKELRLVGIINTVKTEYGGFTKELRVEIAKWHLQQLEELVEALEYIVSHAWANGTTRPTEWVNEFVDVAEEALAKHRKEGGV